MMQTPIIQRSMVRGAAHVADWAAQARRRPPPLTEHTHTQGAPAPRPTERHLCRAAWQRGGGAMHTGGGRGSSHLLQTMPPLFYML